MNIPDNIKKCETAGALQKFLKLLNFDQLHRDHQFFSVMNEEKNFLYLIITFACFRVFGLPADFKEGVVFSTYATLVSSVQKGIIGNHNFV